MFGDGKRMYIRNSAALNFEVVEKQKKKARIIELPSKKARKAAKLKAQRMLITSAFSVFCSCALGVSFFVMGQAQLTEITDMSCKASHKLEQLQSLNTELAVKLKSLNTTNSFKDKNDASVEIVKVHKGDFAKRS